MGADIVITYCKPCGYAGRAEQAAQVIRQRLGVEVRLEPGKGGVFQLSVDGTVLVKRSRTFSPGPEDMVQAVGAALKRGQSLAIKPLSSP